ncbi:hypothetical protein J422_04665 [Methanocaldococcus villosus KIN24-T80]|uniref:DUF22 domain-containing protein n=1 Tax=Methanocaldococcus villosus KIN24-T80 TaxID=1069083 RepID=N6UUI8_9EURY|nr:DUF22 domain-containing protein [Methanocaldococcus villosus]ENN96004.1 hypothetical protein J422_04665 [Methanocaldococcus villosus KIN24-T80]
MFRVLGRLPSAIKMVKAKERIFKIKNENVKLVPIVADEDKEFKLGEVKPIKIKKIKIPPNHLTILCAYARHRLGHVIAIGEDIPLPLDAERSADMATFACGCDGVVKKNDLIGMLILVEVEKL